MNESISTITYVRKYDRNFDVKCLPKAVDAPMTFKLVPAVLMRLYFLLNWIVLGWKSCSSFLTVDVFLSIFLILLMAVVEDSPPLVTSSKNAD